MPEEDSRAIHFQEAAAIVRLCAEVQCERMAPDFDVDDDTEAVARKIDSQARSRLGRSQSILDSPLKRRVGHRSSRRLLPGAIGRVSLLETGRVMFRTLNHTSRILVISIVLSPLSSFQCLPALADSPRTLIRNAALILTMDPTVGTGELGILEDADLMFEEIRLRRWVET